MSKKSLSDDASASNETTEQALVALTIQIKEFVQNRSLDSRFAAKLVKRLKKEADAISEGGNATKPGQKELKKAFEAVEAVLRDHDAALLVTANAALRETDNATSSKKSQQRATEGWASLCRRKRPTFTSRKADLFPWSHGGERRLKRFHRFFNV